MLLIGEYQAKLTEKNRIALPKKFREIMGTRLIVTNGYEGCLIVVTEAQFEEITSDISVGKFVNNDVRDTTRFLLGGASEIELDSQGRFVLPSNLLDYSGIKNDACFLGLKRWAEVWSKEKWDKRKGEIMSSAGEIATRLEKDN
jgi:MraZ protein